MIASLQLADVGRRAATVALRTRLSPASVPGLRYAETMIASSLGGSLLPRPEPGRVGLFAAWDDEAALDRFLTDHPLAKRMSDGWHVRLEPLRVVGSWSRLPGLPSEECPIGGGDPVAVLTLGKLRLRRALPFLRASAAAERQAVDDGALLAATGLARPPRLVATFSLWRTTAQMRAYVQGAVDQGHVGAIHAHAARPFHHESAFLRFRPYDARGTWDGRDPLATATQAGAALTTASP
jgi:hypothetical protein